MILQGHIKKIAWAAGLLSLVLLLIYLGSSQHKKHSSKENASITQKQTGSIKVIEYGTNRIGDIDRILFEQEGKISWLHFPPHTAKFVICAAPKNTVASIVFVTPGKKAPDEKMMYELISISSPVDSFAVHDLPPPPPESGKAIEITGKIREYKLDEKGVPAGFLIGQYIIEIPKHIKDNIVPMLNTADTVTVKGYERNGKDGFVNTSGLILVKPSTVGIGKTNYLL